MLNKSPELSKYLKKLDFGEEVADFAGISESISGIGTASAGVIGKIKAFGAALKGAVVAHPIIAALTAIAAVAGVVANAFMKSGQAMKEAVADAQVAGDAWTTQNDSLEEQKTKLQELRAQLESRNLSEEETYNIKTQILAIQDQIVEQYGSQATGVDLVNGKLEEQLALLDQISISEAQSAYNENSKGFNEAISQMQDERNYSLGSGYGYDRDIKKRIQEIADQYTNIRFFNDSTSLTFDVDYIGTADEAHEDINNFITDLRNLKNEFGDGTYIDDIIGASEKALSKAGEVVDEYGDIYEQAIAFKLAFENFNGSNGLQLLNDYQKAINEYNKALSTGSEEEITAAKENYQDLASTVDEFTSYVAKDAQGNVIKNYGEYEQFFDNVSESLDTAAISAREFNDQLTKSYSGMVAEISEQNLSDYGLLNLDEGALPAWDKLKQAAEEHHVSVDDLVASLANMGAVAKTAAEETVEATEGLTFLGVMNDTEDGNFQEQIDLYQESLTSLNEKLKQLKTEGFSDEEMLDFYQAFPTLAESADDLEAGLTKVANANIVNMMAQLEAQIKKVTEEGGDTSGFEALRQAIIDTVDPSQYDLDTLKELVTESVIPDLKVHGKEAEESAERLKNVYRKKFKEFSKDFTDEDWEIMYKLSLDPDSGNWRTFEKWKAELEAERIKIGIDLEDTPALDAYNEALESTNSGDRYLKMMEAYEKGVELYNQGLVGTDDFKTIAEMFSANGMDDVVNWEENLAKIERYMTEDSTGVKNFLNDLTQKTNEAGEAMASYNAETGQWSLNLDDLEANAHTMGMSFEWLTAMLGRLEDYGFNLNVFGNVEDGVTKLSDLYGDLAAESEKLRELEALKDEGNASVTDSVISQQQEKVEGLKQQILSAEDLLDQLMNKSLQDYEQEAYGAGKMIQNLLEYRGQTNSTAVQGMLTDQIMELADKYHIELVFDTEGNIIDAILPQVSAAQETLDQNPLNVKVDEGFKNKINDGVKANQDSLQQYFDTLSQYSASEIASIDFDDGQNDELFGEAEAAIDQIIDKLGLSQDEALALVQALSELGFIELRVDEPEVAVEEVQQAITNTPLVFDNLDTSVVTDEFVSKIQSGVQDAGDSLQEYLDTLSSYTPEEIAAIDFNDEEIGEAEAAINNIADVLGVSRDNAAALVEVLAQLGFIQFEAEVTNPEEPGEQIQEAANQQPIEYKAGLSVVENKTPLIPGTENISVQVDSSGAEDTLDGLENRTILMDLAVNDQEAKETIDSLKAYAEEQKGIMPLWIDNAEALQTLTDTKTTVDESEGTMNIDGDNQEAINSIDDAANYATSQFPKINVGANTSKLTTDINTALSGTRTINVRANVIGLPTQFPVVYKDTDAFGTAHAYGTIETPGLALWNNYRASIGAYAQGNDWALFHDEDALVNELGTESIVRDGKWFPIPGGAHVEHLKRNDIIFSAEQTKELIKTGRVISGGGHGKVIGPAYAHGTATAGMDAYAGIAGGNGGFAGGAATGADGSGLDGAGQAIQQFTSNVNNASGATKDYTDTKEDEEEEVEKVIEDFDHMETFLGRLSSKFNELGSSLTDFSSDMKRVRTTLKQLSNVRKQYEANEEAAKVYTRKAESVSYTKTENDQEVTYALSEDWKQKVRDGNFSIETVDFTGNEELKEAIQEYQEWYEKMLDCRQAMVELKAEQVELYDQWLQIPLDRVNSKIEKYTDNINKATTALDAYIANCSKAVQAMLQMSQAGSNALDSVEDILGEYGEYTPEQQIAIGESTIDTEIANLEKIKNEADKAVNRANKAVESKQAAYDKASNNVTSRAGKILDNASYQSLLTSSQKKQLQKGKAVSLDGVDPNSKLYNSLTAYNKLVDKKDVAEEQYKVAQTKQTEANEMREEAVLNLATATAESPTKRLDNISSAWELQNAGTSALIEQEKASKLSDTDKIRESDYDKIIEYAIQYALDAKSYADAFEDQMNKEIENNNLSGAALKQAQNKLAELRTKEKEADDAVLNYELEAKEVNLTQTEREAQKIDNNISKKEARIALKRAEGTRVTDDDYLYLQEQAKQGIEIEETKIAEFSEMQSMVERGSDKWREYQDGIEAANDRIEELRQSIAGWQNDMEQIELDDFERQSKKANTNISLAQAKMQVKLASGEKVTASDYSVMQANAQADIGIQNQLIAKLKTLQSQVQRGSDKWKEYQDMIDEANAAILRQQKNLEDWADEIRQLKIDELQINLDNAQRVTTEHEAARTLKETMGYDLTESDYQQMIADSRNEQRATEALRAELLKQQSETTTYGSPEWASFQSQIDSCTASINQAKQSQLQYNIEMNNLPLTRLEQELSLLDAVADALKAQINLKKAAGKDLSERDYTSQMSSNSSMAGTLSSAAYEAYKKYREASESEEQAVDGKSATEWKIVYLQYEAEADNARAANEQLKDSLRDDVYWRDFERAHEAVQRLIASLKGMDNLISSDMYFDNDGNITDMGYTHLAAVIKQYEQAREEVQNYTDDLNNLQKLYGRGEYTIEEYKAKFAELQQGLLDSAGDMKSLEEEIINFYKETGQTQLDALMELIDARKEDLNRRKEAYDWAKRMEQSNKEIQNIEAQIAAYENLGDAANEATRAKLAQLKAQRQELQDQIDDEIQEHTFDLSVQALDDLKDNLQEAFDESMKEVGQTLSSIEAIMSQAKDVTESNFRDVRKALNELLKHYGIPTIANATAGFSTGGVVRDEMNSLVENNDMTIARLNPGETILTSKFTDLMPNAVDIMEKLVNKTMNLDAIGSYKVDTPNIIQISYDSLITVNGSVDKDVWPGLQKTVEESYKYMCAQNVKNAAALGIKAKFK